MSVFLVIHTDCDNSDTVRFVCASAELADRCLTLEESPGWSHDEYCCRVAQSEPITSLPECEHGPSSRYSPDQGPGLISLDVEDVLREVMARPLPYLVRLMAPGEG